MIDYTNSEDAVKELYDSFMDSLISIKKYNFELDIIADGYNYFLILVNKMIEAINMKKAKMADEYVEDIKKP